MKTPIHLPILADARDFLTELKAQAGAVHGENWKPWVKKCQEWKDRYPLVLPEHYNMPNHISMYHFSKALSDELDENAIIAAASSGFAIEIFLLILELKKGQRCFNNHGTGSMGFALPAAVGAAVAAAGSGRQIVCVDGDGGFQMNIQELATVRHNNLPIKFFVANNDGYASIRASQMGYFKQMVGADKTSGVGLPDLGEVTRAYGLPFVRITDKKEMIRQIRAVLDMEGPVVCEAMVAPNEERIPRATSYIKPDGSMGSKPLEDLYPFLDREEFKQNMMVPLVEE
jgi:acetolactate synthase-1/2/3 large subunit